MLTLTNQNARIFFLFFLSFPSSPLLFLLLLLLLCSNNKYSSHHPKSSVSKRGGGMQRKHWGEIQASLLGLLLLQLVPDPHEDLTEPIITLPQGDIDDIGAVFIEANAPTGVV